MHGQPNQFTIDFHRSGLTLDEAEADLGLSSRQIKRYMTGDCEPPKLVMDRLN